MYHPTHTVVFLCIGADCLTSSRRCGVFGEASCFAPNRMRVYAQRLAHTPLHLPFTLVFIKFAPEPPDITDVKARLTIVGEASPRRWPATALPEMRLCLRPDAIAVRSGRSLEHRFRLR